MAKSEVRMIANNKKAYHDYFILEKYEAGIVLHGTEVKSLRMGKCSIKEAFIRVESGEMYIYGMHISPYEKGNIFNKDPLRVRKLLLHKKEIDKMFGKMKEQGITLVPLQVYFKGMKLTLEQKLAHGGHPVLRWMMFRPSYKFLCKHDHVPLIQHQYQDL